MKPSIGSKPYKLPLKTDLFEGLLCHYRLEISLAAIKTGTVLPEAQATLLIIGIFGC